MVFPFLVGEGEVAAFEGWLYGDAGLEERLGAERYVALIGLDYRKGADRREACRLLRGAIDLGPFERWRLERALRAVLEAAPGGFETALADVFDLWEDGWFFLDELGLGWGLAASLWRTDRIPPSRPLDAPEVRREVEALVLECLRWLEDGVIVPLGTTDDLGHPEYLDHRGERPG